jgi:hypothetical protein
MDEPQEAGTAASPGRESPAEAITPEIGGRAAGDLASVLRKVKLRECVQGRSASTD